MGNLIEKSARICDETDTYHETFVDIDLYSTGLVEISIVEEGKLVGVVNVPKEEFFKELRISGIIEEG
ncbi:hypothetical protein ANTHOS_22 [Bacillus phage Anthos]|uniref:Uncharacterized protein n=2 Tax=Bequatrovirus troll TaxID=1918009 RepID=A0A7U3TT43_9CAUD|nr:hypothetical protein JUGLONE_22 [Bacillus phage Juglone]QPY77259.1 hypothetical protein ANTHOS_22 [Bacillus phage Anthos]